MPETSGKLNQYLLATSETAEKDYEISVRRRRQSPEPAKEHSQGKAYGAYKFKV